MKFKTFFYTVIFICTLITLSAIFKRVDIIVNWWVSFKQQEIDFQKAELVASHCQWGGRIVNEGVVCMSEQDFKKLTSIQLAPSKSL